MNEDIDLAPAVEAAAKERAARTQGEDWDRLDGYARHMWRESVYREVTAAAPHIVAAVRSEDAPPLSAAERVYATTLGRYVAHRDAGNARRASAWCAASHVAVRAIR